jgi:hypothetical protein
MTDWDEICHLSAINEQLTSVVLCTLTTVVDAVRWLAAAAAAAAAVSTPAPACPATLLRVLAVS